MSLLPKCPVSATSPSPAETEILPDDCLPHESNGTLSGPQSGGTMRHKIDVLFEMQGRKVATTYDTRSEDHLDLVSYVVATFLLCISKSTSILCRQMQRRKVDRRRNLDRRRGATPWSPGRKCSESGRGKWEDSTSLPGGVSRAVRGRIRNESCHTTFHCEVLQWMALSRPKKKSKKFYRFSRFLAISMGSQAVHTICDTLKRPPKGSKRWVFKHTSHYGHYSKRGLQYSTWWFVCKRL